MGARNEVGFLGLGRRPGLRIFWLPRLAVAALPISRSACARFAEHAFSFDRDGGPQ